MTNKIFCTFTDAADLDLTLQKIVGVYRILYKKIFVLSLNDTDDLICTYNVDLTGNSNPAILPKTILLHRHKQSNTLYTINALNTLIRKLNNNTPDKTYPIQWDSYRNSMLLLIDDQLQQYSTRVKNIVDIF